MNILDLAEESRRDKIKRLARKRLESGAHCGSLVKPEFKMANCADEKLALLLVVQLNPSERLSCSERALLMGVSSHK